jgi:hypothetical protein
MANEGSKKFSVLCIDLNGSLITMYEALKTGIKELTDEGISVSVLLDPAQYGFYLARDNQILRVSPATLCRAMGDLFREEGIGCDI